MYIHKLSKKKQSKISALNSTIMYCKFTPIFTPYVSERKGLDMLARHT